MWRLRFLVSACMLSRLTAQDTVTDKQVEAGQLHQDVCHRVGDSFCGSRACVPELEGETFSCDCGEDHFYDVREGKCAHVHSCTASRCHIGICEDGNRTAPGTCDCSNKDNLTPHCEVTEEKKEECKLIGGTISVGPNADVECVCSPSEVLKNDRCLPTTCLNFSNTCEQLCRRNLLREDHRCCQGWKQDNCTAPDVEGGYCEPGYIKVTPHDNCIDACSAGETNPVCPVDCTANTTDGAPYNCVCKEGLELADDGLRCLPKTSCNAEERARCREDQACELEGQVAMCKCASDRKERSGQCSGNCTLECHHRFGSCTISNNQEHCHCVSPLEGDSTAESTQEGPCILEKTGGNETTLHSSWSGGSVALDPSLHPACSAGDKSYSDGEIGVMPTSMIRDFSPTDVKDFKKGEKKKAFWYRKRDREMQGFYDAEVKALAENMGSLLLQLNQQRLPVPGSDFIFDEGDIDPDLTMVSSQKQGGVARKTLKKNERTAKNIQLKGILGKRKAPSSANADPTVEHNRSFELENERLGAELAACKEKLLQEQQEKKRYADMAHDLTKTLLEKIDVLFARASVGSSSPVTSRGDRVTQPAAAVSMSSVPLPAACSTSVLFARASAGLSSPVTSFDGVTEPAAARPACQQRNQSTEHVPTDVDDHIPVFATIDDEIHLGNNVFVPADRFTWTMKSKSDALFCKDLAKVLWDVPVLLNRSVTGTICPRFAKEGAVAKPGLSPHKLEALTNAFGRYVEGKPSTELDPETRTKQVKKHLANFLRDLRRSVPGTNAGGSNKN